MTFRHLLAPRCDFRKATVRIALVKGFKRFESLRSPPPDGATKNTARGTSPAVFDTEAHTVHALHLKTQKVNVLSVSIQNEYFSQSSINKRLKTACIITAVIIFSAWGFSGYELLQLVTSLQDQELWIKVIIYYCFNVK